MAAVSRNPQPPRVLVVDDDPTTVRVLEGLLHGAGFETLSARDLGRAEALAHSQPISLILLDVHLPDGSGLDLCEKLTAEPALESTPILFISANDDVSIKVRGFAVGAVDYVTKPLAGAEVLARIRTHLRLRAAFDSLVALQAERIQRLSVSQQMLMPQPNDLPDARFRVCVRQAERAGGDFYDVMSSGSRITDYVVADASGHDLGASLWTASFKTLLAEYGSIVHTPHDVFRMINRSLRRVLPEGVYFTAIYARLNRATNKLGLVNAGHPAAILLSRQTREVRLLCQEGDVIGIFADAVFGFLEILVKPGDRLFLYSDGLVEMNGCHDAGTKRVEDVCLLTAELPLENAVSSVVNTLRAEVDADDDIVLMGIEV